MAIAMAIRVSLLSLLVISSANLTFALCEDQVDLMDWYQQHIGKVLQAVFQTLAVWKRVVVAAEENAIAYLDLRHGDIYAVSLLSAGSILRAGNFPEGLLVWESFHQISQPSKSLLYIPVSNKNPPIREQIYGYVHSDTSSRYETLRTQGPIFIGDVLFTAPASSHVIHRTSTHNQHGTSSNQ